jgi:hypothetical protein
MCGGIEKLKLPEEQQAKQDENPKDSLFTYTLMSVRNRFALSPVGLHANH